MIATDIRRALTIMKDPKGLRPFINSIHELPEDSYQSFLDIMEEVKYPKGKLLTREGEIEQYIYFVLEGAQRMYHIKNGKEHVIHLTYHPAFTGIPESFLAQKPSYCYLECMTDSRFLRFSREYLDELMDHDHQMERFVRKATTEVLVGIVERYYGLMSLPMKERFIKFMKGNANLLQLVPHKHLASYLNMDPTNFSKLLGTNKIG